MMAFPGMLVEAAKQAGMKVPADPDNYDREEYPHFEIFCITQLCRPIRIGEHWDNAKVVAAVPENELMTITISDLIARGLEWRTS